MELLPQKQDDYIIKVNEGEKISGTKNYSVSGGEVNVRHKKYDGAKYADNSSINLFMPGFSVREDALSIGEFCTFFSEQSGAPTFAVDTIPLSTGKDVIESEAEAVMKFIEEKGAEKVTIIGHSRGGTKAMHLAYQLQEKSEIDVKSLVLFNSVGLYKQSLPEIMFYAGSDFIQTNIGIISISRKPIPPTAAHDQIPKISQSLIPTAILTQAEKIAKAKFNYPANLLKELECVKEINPYVHQIKAPVILITGINDKLCDPKKLIPEKDGEKKYLEDMNEREVHLKKTIFRSSPSVKMLVAKKLAYHNDFIFRPRSFAKASCRLIRSITSGE